MPFVEFSILRENTYAGLSKYHFVRALFSVAGIAPQAVAGVKEGF
jgi:hypothetical protein